MTSDSERTDGRSAPSSGLAVADVVLAHQTIRGATPPQSLEAAAAAGFGGITMRVVPDGGSTEASVVAGMAMVAETIEAAQRSGVAIADVECVILHPEWQPDEARPVIEAGAAVGARYINVMVADPDEARAIESFGSLCELAAEAELRPSLEFMVFTEVKTIEQAHRIVTEVGHPAGSITVDALHLSRGGGTVADVVALAERDPALFTCLHLCDAPRAPAASEAELFEEALAGRLMPGEGDLPLLDLVDVLPQASVYVEAPVKALATETVAARAAAAAAALRSL